MAFQVSPGVNISEIDLTTVVPAVATSVGAFAGVFSWGPAEERTLVSSENTLVSTFGKPTADNYETFYTAANFLAYGNALYVVRAIDAAAKNAQAIYTGTEAATIQIKNLDDYQDGITASTNAVYYARYAGTLGNSLKISVCDSANAYSNALDMTDGAATIEGTLTLVPNSLTANLRVVSAVSNTAANTSATSIIGKIKVGDYLVVNGQSQYLKVASLGAAVETGNASVFSAQAVITFDSKFTGSANATANSSNALTRYWEYYNVVDKAPGQSTFVAAYGNTFANDELHIVVVDEDGLFTGVKNQVLEVFEGVSRATDAKADNGQTLYYKTVIENDSQYIYWAKHRPTSSNNQNWSNTALLVASSAQTLPMTTSFVAGVDTTTESTVTLGTLGTAYDLFKDPDIVDVSLVMVGKANTDVANYVIDNIATTRKDCVAFVSPTRSTSADSIVTFRNTLSSTSYAVIESGYKYQYDRYNDVYRYIPLNGDIAGLCARTDSTNDPWYSPAGFSRGQIKNVVKLNFNPNQAERDVLYKNGVNPVVTFPGQGTILFGDKTMLTKPSAFDRINVRRLFIVLEKAISTAAKFALFEFNDEFTRAQFRNLVEPYLREVQGRRGITDYRVICDTTNNTGDVIDRGEFVGDIYIKPARSINYIQLNFVAVRSGVDFNEIVKGV
jgi:phage tail sheath protein FI